jgi:hypothetical protein
MYNHQYSNNLEVVKKLFEALSNTQAVLLTGDNGLYQDKILEHMRLFISENDMNVKVLVIQASEKSYELWPIIDALSHINDVDLRANIDEIIPYNDILAFSGGVMVEEQIFRALVKSLSSCSKLMITVESVCLQKETVLQFIIRLMNYAYIYGHNLFTLFDLSGDEDECIIQMNRLKPLKAPKEYIRFDPWDAKELETLFLTKFDNNVTISAQSLGFVIGSCLGNPTKLENNIEYLHAVSVVYKDESGRWICKDIEQPMLGTTITEHIRQRYNKLDNILRSTLQRSSILDIEFSSALLKNPLEVIRADEKLRSVEAITRLIQHTKLDRFKFQNATVQLSIRSYVADKDYLQWNHALGDFYVQTAKAQSENLFETSDSILKAAFYYKESNELPQSLQCYVRTLPLLMGLNQFNDALDVLEKIESLREALAQGQPYVFSLYRAECCRQLFDNTRASKSYVEYLNNANISESERQRVLVLYASTLYNSGFMEKPRTILLEIYNTLSACIDKKNILVYLNSCLLLTAIDETSNKHGFESYYQQALVFAKKIGVQRGYYSLLRCATLVYDCSISIKLMKEACTYFKEHDDMKELAMTYHNIGSTIMYEENLNTAEEYLHESYKILTSFGSYGAYYVQNSLALLQCFLYHDYQRALDMLLDCLNCTKMTTDAYYSIAIQLNISTCYRKLGKLSLCKQMLSDIATLLCQDENNSFSLLKAYRVLCSALLACDSGLLQDAYELLLVYISEYAESGHFKYIYSIQLMKSICDKLELDYPEIILPYIDADCIGTQRLRAENVILHRFMFWEL